MHPNDPHPRTSEVSALLQRLRTEFHGSFQIQDCDFHDASFSGEDLRGIGLRFSNLTGSSLEGASIDEGTDLTGCKWSIEAASPRGWCLIPVSESSGLLVRASEIPRDTTVSSGIVEKLVSLSGVDPYLQLVLYRSGTVSHFMLDLAGTPEAPTLLYDADLSGFNEQNNCSLQDTHLDYVDFRGSDLSHSNFTSARLRNSNLSDTYMEGSLFVGAHLQGTIFDDLPEIEGACFDYARRGASDPDIAGKGHYYPSFSEKDLQEVGQLIRDPAPDARTRFAAPNDSPQPRQAAVPESTTDTRSKEDRERPREESSVEVPLHSVRGRKRRSAKVVMEEYRAGKRLKTELKLARRSLRGGDLRGLDLSLVDMRDCDLQQADCTGAQLVGACLQYASVSGAHFTDADLSGAILIGIQGLGDSTFDGERLNLRCAFVTAREFDQLSRNPLFSRGDWQLNKLQNLVVPSEARQEARGEKFNYRLLDKWKGYVEFIRLCQNPYRGAAFHATGAHLSDISFEGLDLSPRLVLGEDARPQDLLRFGANFSGSTIENCSFAQTTLSGANLSGVAFRGRNSFCGARLNGCSLEGVHGELATLDFRGASLAGAFIGENRELSIHPHLRAYRVVNGYLSSWNQES